MFWIQPSVPSSTAPTRACDDEQDAQEDGAEGEAGDDGGDAERDRIADGPCHGRGESPWHRGRMSPAQSRR
jgi:hypothetical protein